MVERRRRSDACVLHVEVMHRDVSASSPIASSWPTSSEVGKKMRLAKKERERIRCGDGDAKGVRRHVAPWAIERSDNLVVSSPMAHYADVAVGMREADDPHWWTAKEKPEREEGRGMSARKTTGAKEEKEWERIRCGGGGRRRFLLVYVCGMRHG